MSRRPTAVAGCFYPAEPERLRARVSEVTCSEKRPVCARAVVVPHAGYVYSGRVAGETFARVEVPGIVCILATNHTGVGPAFSVWPGGAWETPMGDAPVDAALTAAILEACPGAQEDESAERREHSAEVELPFILHRNPAARISVVTVASFRLMEGECLARLMSFGAALGRVLGGWNEPVLTVASSDMSHSGEAYGQAAPPGRTADGFAREQDPLALDRILALDPEGLYHVVRERRVTMCGCAPVVVALCAALAEGASRAEVVRYATSAEVSGNVDQVVGYAGIVVS